MFTHCLHTVYGQEHPQEKELAKPVAVFENPVDIQKLVEELSTIFEPYFTTKLSGTGLGLTIVLNIIQADNKIDWEIRPCMTLKNWRY